MYEIKYKTDTLRNSIPAGDILKKKVIARNGKKVGEIGGIYIHPKRLTVEGIKVKKGILEVGDFIGKGYIQSLNHEGAMLKITPVRELLHMLVYDSAGKKIGKVKDVKRSNKTNNISSVVIDRGLLKDDAIVLGSSIREISKNMTLKVQIRDK